VARGGRRACREERHVRNLLHHLVHPSRRDSFANVLLLPGVSRVSGYEGRSVATYVALAADHLVAVVLGGKSLERGLDDTTTETEDKVKSRLLLDVVVGKGAAILELLSGEDQALLVWGNALLVLDLGLDVVDGVGGLDLKGDGLARKGLDEAVWRLLSVGVLCGLRCAGARRTGFERLTSALRHKFMLATFNMRQHLALCSTYW
jgi:hypothetical protein